MAAGGVDVLRRDSRFSREDFGYNDSGSRQDRFYGRAEERKAGRFSSAKNGEASKIEDMASAPLPHEKKRRFSLIKWEKKEKDVRVSSKKRVAAITPPSPPPCQSRSPSRVLDSVSDGKAAKVDVSGLDNWVGAEVSTVEADVIDECANPGLLPQCYGDAQKIQDQMEAEEIVMSRTISMSRWATVADSLQPMSDGECTPYTGRSSSTESGEFQREGSSGVRIRMSSSNEEDCYVGSGSGGKSSRKEFSGGSYEDVGTNRVDYDSEADDEYSHIDEPTVFNRQHVNMLQSCRSVFEYEKLNKINEGTYGVVYKARDKKTGEIVALKKVKMDVTKDDCGFPLTSLREINILSSFSHPSIVDVKEVAMDNDDGVYMVMEYMEHDLKGLMEKMKAPFSIGEVKWLMLQLLEGVNYLHDNWVLHRDLKTSNLLLNTDGKLKICDFGMSRQYGSPLKPYTSLVVTLWYRAPELLLGAKEYTTAVDMWSVGCIMGELVAKCPLFRGKNEVEQLDKIFRTLGTPNETVWSGFSKLPGSKAKFVKQPYNVLRKKFPPTSFIGSPVLSDLGFDLLSRLLTHDPEKRITAEAALNHKWFVEAPLPQSDFQPSPFAVQSQSRYIGSRQ